MRPMTLLASVVFPSMLLATLQVACSSDNGGNSTQTPFDSGTIVAPEASVAAGSVTIVVVGKGLVVSDDGVPHDGGPNGFAGPDGGSPAVDCSSSGGACSAPQGTVLYAVPAPYNVFAGWSVGGGEGGAATIASDNNLTITPGVGGPVTATFVPASAGADAAPPPPVKDAGGAG